MRCTHCCSPRWSTPSTTSPSPAPLTSQLSLLMRGMTNYTTKLPATKFLSTTTHPPQQIFERVLGLEGGSHLNWRPILCSIDLPSKEDVLCWTTTFDGRWLLMKDNLWLKTVFDGRRPLMEDNLQRKTTFNRRQPYMGDDLWWNTTFNEIWPSMEEEAQ